MGPLVTIKELAEELEIKVSKIRRWTKKGILTPISKSKDDGKSFLYQIDCVKIKLEVLDSIRIDFTSLDEIGARFKKAFGRRDCDLLLALQTMGNRKELIKKYAQEIRGLESG